MLRSPDFALLDGVHFRSGLAMKVSGEIVRIRKWADHPEPARRMSPGLDPLLQGLWPVLGAPRVGCSDPEELLLVQAEPWKLRFLTVT